jgi:dihydrofolate reductase
MIRITYAAASSLDGFIAAADGSVDWLTPFQGEQRPGFMDFYKSVDALLMGSHTYEFALKAQAWPSPDKRTWVFSKRNLRILDPSISLTTQTPTDFMRTLQTEKIEHAWLMGGGALASSFRSERLISHYVLLIMPVMLGRGIPLFAASDAGTPLKMTGITSLKNGVVEIQYEGG